MKSVFRTILVAITIVTFASMKPGPGDYKATMEGWEVDLNKAITESKLTGKPIMANFTGSDWCGWCIRLKNEVFTKDEFKTWAKEEVILLELDFPKRKVIPDEYKQQNLQLAQAFGVRGYPTIWVFDVNTDESTNQSQLNALAKSGYVAGGPAAWTKDMDGKLAASKTPATEQK